MRSPIFVALALLTMDASPTFGDSTTDDFPPDFEVKVICDNFNAAYKWNNSINTYTRCAQPEGAPFVYLYSFKPVIENTTHSTVPQNGSGTINQASCTSTFIMAGNNKTQPWDFIGQTYLHEQVGYWWLG
jgi:hypothetical protein